MPFQDYAGFNDATLKAMTAALTYTSRNTGRLTFGKETFVPDRFAIYSSFRSRRSRSCRVTWRKGNEVGFEYIVDKVPPMQQRSEKL
jgi:hypothetical protein